MAETLLLQMLERQQALIKRSLQQSSGSRSKSVYESRVQTPDSKPGLSPDPRPDSVGSKPGPRAVWLKIKTVSEEDPPSNNQKNSQTDFSFVSMKSDDSMIRPILFKDGTHSTNQRNSQTDSSFVSMKSDDSMIRPILFKDKQRNSQTDNFVSMKSDDSMIRPILFKDGPHSTNRRNSQTDVSLVSMKSDNSMIRPILFKDNQSLNEQNTQKSQKSGVVHQQQPNLMWIFELLEDNIISFVKTELKKFQTVLTDDYPECSAPVEDEEAESSEALLKISLNFLRRMKQEKLADSLLNRKNTGKCRRKLKSHLQQKFECVFEGITKAGLPTLLKQIYTELYITEGGASEVNQEHEVRLIETTSRKPDRPETAITCEDIFKGPADTDGPIRTVLTKGVAGVGKTVLTQKFSLDWAEGRSNRDVQLLFPFTFRELNVLRDRQFSLVGLLHHFFSQSAGLCSFEQLQVLFIFDGLDECRLPLDFTKTQVLTEATESSSVDVLLVNLIRGSLLPNARLWITTRPAAANQIPAECVSMVTEVRGFTDPQKEEYFRKRFGDWADTIVSNIRTSRSLHIMCHIPVFCWITATVLLHVMETGAKHQLPQTLTEIYIHFLVVQAKVKSVKYDGRSESEEHWTKDNMEMVESLAKLAFEQLQKGKLIFYESDLRNCGIDIEAASKYSGFFTAVFKKEKTVNVTVFCFVHLSVQEFLAALHVHLTFVNSGVNLLAKETWLSKLRRSKRDLIHLHQSAVDQTLQSPNGHLDLVLRFLLGLSLETDESLLRALLTKTGRNPEARQKTIDYIKQRLNKDLPSEQSISLLHCLNELQDHSLEEDIQQYLLSGGLDPQLLSPAQWSTLAFLLLSSNRNRDMFDLKEYCASEEAFLKLLPVVEASTKVLLSGCSLTRRSCAALSTVLSSTSSNLRDLDLSNNDLSVITDLCRGLQSPDCKLETLRMSSCNLTEMSCTVIFSLYASQSLSLRELDLSNNDLQDSGVDKISWGLKSPFCKLEALRLSGCLVSEEGCASLVSALSSECSHLRELDLSYNHPGGSGLELLRNLQKDPGCRLETLRMDHCGPSRLTPGPRKYLCELTLDPNTAHKNIKLSRNNRTAASVTEEQPCQGHPDRFDHWCQVLCSTPLIGRCYWEVDWSRQVDIAVTHKRICRKGRDEESLLGSYEHSWSLHCSRKAFFVLNNGNQRYIRSSPDSERVAVYLDFPAGSLSFYSVSESKELSHIHTFHDSFTEPLFAGFGFGSDSGSSVSLV